MSMFLRFMFRLPATWMYATFFIVSLCLSLISYSLNWLAKLITFNFKPKYATEEEKRAALVILLDEVKEGILELFDYKFGEVKWAF